MKLSPTKWTVRRSTGVFRGWSVQSPWRVEGRYLKSNIGHFATWREAFDYADRMARS